MASRSLSALESRVVLALEAQGTDELTLDTIETLAGIHRGHARKLAHQLLLKGWTVRLGRGRYLLNPTGYGPDAGPETDPLRLAGRLVRPYYLGYATAAELLGLLLRPGPTYYVVTPTRSSIRLTRPATFRLVRVARRRFFGARPMVRRGNRLVVSDPERTVIDCLDRPELAGGIAGACQVLARAKPRLDWRRLSGYLLRFGSRSVARRLGYLAEHVRPAVAAPGGWAARWRPGSPEPWVPLGPPSAYGRTGPRDRRWGVVLNVPPGELFAEADTR
jgi:predicted transcriptional regulator of viral defense system